MHTTIPHAKRCQSADIPLTQWEKKKVDVLSVALRTSAPSSLKSFEDNKSSFFLYDLPASSNHLSQVALD